MSDTELMPCPFCGNQPRISSSAFHAGYATCQAVGVPEDRWHPAVTMTIEQWQRRTPPSTAGWLPIATAPKMSSADIGCYDDEWTFGGDLHYMHWVLDWLERPPTPSQEGAEEGEG